jgi:glycosyltransferase involved in cell wall biosynthesis
MDASIKVKNKESIAIVSTCIDDWGGSEELWGRSIPFLLKDGHSATVYKDRVNTGHPEIAKLIGQGVVFREIVIKKSFFKKGLIKIIDKIKGRNTHNTFIDNEHVDNLIALIEKDRPTFAIISQGINFDALCYAYVFRLLNIPYVIVSQKAVEFYWPNREDRHGMAKVFEEAKACYFVSKHNLLLTEEQFGKRLSNAHVIFNPIKIGKTHPYPDTGKGIKLACVGRLFLIDKGQDILLRILDNKKWRDRPITVTFVGQGVDEEAIKDMAALLDIKNVSFAGQVQDMDELWRNYHGLVLPSRSEGLPLSIVEAMAAGRVVIVSKAGGNTELLQENVTGFSGHINEESFDEAMERAWNQLDNWEAIGKEAAKQIKTLVPASPEKIFAKHVLEIINRL